MAGTGGRGKRPRPQKTRRTERTRRSERARTERRAPERTVRLPDEATMRRLDERERSLLELRDALRDRGATDASEQGSSIELSSYDQHLADVGTETFERSKELSILGQVEAQLGDVLEAKRRLEEGRYGLCAACGRPIGEARLDAMPEVRFCIEDQQRVEREVALEATPERG